MTWQKKSPLFIDEILDWADAHYERTGDWPIPNHRERVYEAPEENWRAIDAALWIGCRGLPPGNSLPRLLETYRGRRNQKNLPEFRLHDILAWADAHFKRTGSWPHDNSGPVLDAPGETWAAIQAALFTGLRGLPGGYSLARLLADHREVQNRLYMSPLSIEQILDWADAFHKQYGRWPTQDAGGIEGELWETWSSCDYCLRNGARGLPGGSSLARLLGEARGTRNRTSIRPLDVEQILQWADAHHAKTGRWPRAKDGPVSYGPNETWAAIDSALSYGLRSLPGGTTLAKLLHDRRGVRYRPKPPDLSEAQILEWADAHHERFGGWPQENQGRVFKAPEESWDAVDAALRVGSRGLPGGSSLPQLLDRERGVRNGKSLPGFQIERVLEWADAHRSRTGEWPHSNSGSITEAPEERWSHVDRALVKGLRGLPGGSSLARLLAQHRGVRNVQALPILSTAMVLNWADEHFARTGRWPQMKSGLIPGAAGDTWRAVDHSLRSGSRGLPKDSSLARLLAEHRGVRNRKDPGLLDEDDIVRWIIAFRERTGKWPTRRSGPIEDAPGETWVAVYDALRNGFRGMAGGTSLTRLIRARCASECGAG